MIFYDFEVFKYDWLVVAIDVVNQKEHVIVNDTERLEQLYCEHKQDIWVGFNSRHYDQYILKGILAGFNPKRINDWIIVKHRAGWEFSSLLRKFPLYNYDVMQANDGGLKRFEGFMGNNIKESSVPFDIHRKLTASEISETIKYCRHDVEQTIEVFLERKDDFEAQMGLLKMFYMPLMNINKTKVQLSAQILDASKRTYNDEFDICFPDTMRIKKYNFVVDWYMDKNNRKYRIDPRNEKSEKHKLSCDIAGVPHQFGWGGVHGALEQYCDEGYFLMMDVASLYPNLMIRYNLHSRSCNPQKFNDIVDLRLTYKHEGNPLQAPLKIVINGTYGAMKAKSNPLYDPRQANNVCVHGQLLLLDLIEKLEPHCKIIQSNTDGILVKLNAKNDKEADEQYSLIDDIAYEWEQRTGLTLEFDEYRRVYQKDVNNYVIVPDGELYDKKGKPRWKSKGAYVKKLNNLDYDLPIVNKAMVDFMVKGIPVEKTILECDELKEFQQVKKISSKYSKLLYGTRFESKGKKVFMTYNNTVELNEKCIRCFASKDKRDGGLAKVHAETKAIAKLEGTPEHAFLFNDEVNGVKCPSKLDKQWYIDLANQRLKDFGVM